MRRNRARESSFSKSAAGHKCLVMTGSGDPAFVKNFNPYTATGLPSGQFIKGAVYEGLIISPEGGLPARPWLAQSWKWSNGNKTLTLNLVQNAKWSDGKPLTSADVVYSLKGGDNATQQKTMDLVGFSRPGSNFASIAAKGQFVRDQGLGGTIIWTINQGHLASGAVRDPLLQAARGAFLD